MALGELIQNQKESQMTDYAACPWCQKTSMVTAKVLDRKCEHARTTHVQLPVGDQLGGTVVRFSTPDQMEFKNVLCAVRSVMTDKRFFTAIDAMDLDMVDEIERKLAHRRAVLLSE